MKLWMPDDPALPLVAETSSFQAEALISLLGDIDDPRVLGRVKHALPDVLFTALVAMLCGCDSFSAMGMFAQTQLGWLRTHVPLVNGAPSHDVFRNLLMLIQPVALIEIL